MESIRRGIGMMLVGVLGWAHASQADALPDLREPTAWVIETADYTGDVREQIARLEATYTIRLIRDGWTEIPLAIQGATITDITIGKKAGDAHLMPRGAWYALAAGRKGVYVVRVKCSMRLVQDSQFEGVQFGVPQATFSTMALSVPRKDVELRPADQLYVERHPLAGDAGVKLTARLGAANRVDLRWGTKPAAPVKVEPVLYGEVNTLLVIEEQLARFTSIIQYRMAQGDTKTLVVTIPSGPNVLNVRGAGIEDWRVTDAPDHKTLTVTLGVALKDAAYRLMVEGEQTLADTRSYTLPEIQLANVKQERGYLAVARSGSVELSPETAEGINRVDVRELPEPLRDAMGSPATLAFKYHQHPYRVSLALTRHDDHPVLAAIAERGELVTVVSRQGEVLTRASYLIKANKKQFLEVSLPEGATLWSCLVAGKSVKPVEGKERKLLVPLDAMTDAVTAVSVELVYFERRPELVRIGRLQLQGPVLDAPTTVSNWAVYAPREVAFLHITGNLERGAAAGDFVEEPFVPRMALASEGRRDEEKSYGEKDDQMVGSARLKSANKQAAVAGQMEAASAPTSRVDSPLAMDRISRLQEAGIFPLKIRLPKSGSVYRFNRLMTTQEALRLTLTFVHVRLPQVPLAAFGLALMPVLGLATYRFRRG